MNVLTTRTKLILLSAGLIFVGLIVPLLVYAAAPCFGDGVSCTNNLQTLSTPPRVEYIRVGSDVLFGFGESNDSVGQIFKWQAAQQCLGNGSSCGTPLQTIPVLATYVGDMQFLTVGTDTLLVVADPMSATVAGRVYKWQAAQNCFGNGSSCGSILQTITIGLSGAPNVIDWHPFSQGGVTYLLGTAYSGPSFVYQWQPAGSCFGNGSSCSATVQSMPNPANDGGSRVFSFDSNTYLAFGAHTSIYGSHVYIWQPTQKCFGDGTTCSNKLQTGLTAGTSEWGFVSIGDDHYLIQARWNSVATNMFLWQSDDECFGNGTTCGTAFRTLPMLTSWETYASGEEVYLMGSRSIAGSPQTILYKWRSTDQCFGDEVACEDSPGGYSNSHFIWSTTAIGGQDFQLVNIGGNQYYVVGTTGQGVRVLIAPPNVPSVTASSTGLVATAITFTLNAVDPQGGQVRYGVDWDNNSTVDEWVPASGYVASGVSASTTHTWNLSGVKAYQVVAQDEGGTSSSWQAASITINDPVPTVLLTATPDTIYEAIGESSTLEWSSSDAAYCVGNFATGGSGPAAPSLVGTYNTSGTASGVVISGNYAYVADDVSGLHIINISDPASPALTGTYNTSGSALEVFVSGSYAYVADGSAGLRVINISNPASPTLSGTYNGSGSAMDVFVSGSYAYVAYGNPGLRIINISNPASPTLVGSYNTSGTANGVTVSGSYAYVADGSSGLQIVNISNPASPSLVGTYNTTGSATDVSVSGSYAYVADGSDGLSVINISNPAAPTLIDTYDTTSAQGSVVSGSYAYLSDSGSGLRIVDISNPTELELETSYDTSGSALDTFISGAYAYIADGSAGLRVVNVSGVGGGGGLSGTLSVSPTETTEYSITCTGEGGDTTEEVSVTVVPSCQVVDFCEDNSIYRRSAMCAETLVEECEYLCVDDEEEGTAMCTTPCTESYYCGVDGNAHHRDTQCVDTVHQICPFGCSGGACLGAPSPDSMITAIPELVRSRERTTVTWDSDNTTLCTVSGTNGDIWTGVSGSQSSSPLLSQTIYTLTCTGVDGTTIIEKATVNITPIFQEV